MGYTTKFKGTLTITPLPSGEIVECVNKISKTRHDAPKYPGIWCQWIVNENGKLEWNGGEKFYNYVEWLQYLVDNIFIPSGYVISGRVRYIGERFDDVGVIYVKDNIIKNICGIYDVSDDEIIISATMNDNGKITVEILS